ncbi:hypothetical protein AB0756_39770 [Tolypothrix campylonemoides VB511288_2]|uniref:Uncharacterized protein n=2 Tax=Tolypothrix TaxID=111782 RepID=A0A0C1MVR2_9CYAN
MIERLQNWWQQAQDIFNLIFLEEDFLEQALERDYKSDELQTDEKQKKKRDFYKGLIRDSKKARSEARHFVLISVIPALIITIWIKSTVKSEICWLEIVIKFFSISLVAFATLNRIKEPKSFDGNTLIEITNTNLFKLLYCPSFAITLVTITASTLLMNFQHWIQNELIFFKEMVMNLFEQLIVILIFLLNTFGNIIS